MAGAIITVKTRESFTVLPNRTLRDNRLSLKTRAILAIMISLPEDWDYTVSGLAAICDVGKDAVRTSLLELENCGYLTRTQRHSEDGHFSQNEYIVTDSPLSGYPSTVEPSADEPLTDNPTQQNKDCTNTPYSPPGSDAVGGTAGPVVDTSGGNDGPRGSTSTASKHISRRSGPKAAPDWKPERFARFWDYYPRGESKQAAIRAWDKLKPSDELIDEMAQALRRQIGSEAWRSGVGIPYASTWLNNQRWTDVPKAGLVPAGPVVGTVGGNDGPRPLRGEGVQYL